MERLIILALHNAYAGKLTVSEREEGVFVNTGCIGNSKFKGYAKRNFIDIEYVGGNNYKILL